MRVGCCRGFGFCEGGGGVDLVAVGYGWLWVWVCEGLVAVRVVAGVVVVVVAGVAVSCWVGFGRGWVEKWF